MMSNDRVAIMVEIVRFCELSRDKARIINSLSLNSVQAEAYLAILTQRKLLAENKNKYQTTEHGQSFLTTSQRLNRIIGQKG
jgi:predicted transcriptional regulator